MNISIWEKESFYARQDVIIIGGGIAGLWCAYELLCQNPALQLLILDSGMIPSGASTRNAGFACFGSPTELIHDAGMIGEEGMLQLAEMRFKGIEKIRRILGDEAIDYDNCGGYECLQKNISCIEDVAEKLDWLNKAMKAVTGSETTFALADDKLTAFGLRGFDALIENRLEGSLHSGKLVMELQKKVRSLGGQILQGLHIEKWQENGNGVTVFANTSITIETSRLLLCTNALSNHLLPDIHITPARGQILVTAPVDNLTLRGTFHFDKGFYYFRNIGNRILLGGARNTAFEEQATTLLTTTSAIQQTLEQFLSIHILPEQEITIEYRWSGIMGFTEDKLPVLKQLSDNVIAVIICNGMGVAMAPMIAEQVAQTFF